MPLKDQHVEHTKAKTLLTFLVNKDESAPFHEFSIDASARSKTPPPVDLKTIYERMPHY
jgi:hypothetical protein